MRNLDWNIYTYKHRRAFAYCVKKLIRDPGLREQMLKRAEVHDMDKMLMYLFLDQKTAQITHVKHQPHHLENDLPRTYEDLVETVIDYECAPYTKPDKPLNAYEFVLKLNEMKLIDDAMRDQLISIMRDLGIDHSGTVQEDTEGLAYMESIGEVTEDMIMDEILSYVNSLDRKELETVLNEAGIKELPF